jgi:hypothetical protein
VDGAIWGGRDGSITGVMALPALAGGAAAIDAWRARELDA